MYVILLLSYHIIALCAGIMCMNIVAANHIHASRSLALDIDRVTGAPRASGDYNKDGTPRSKL
jgi:hypothetical protein